MSIVIIGGNECMERRYVEECKKYGCKAKVFAKPCTDMKSRIGNPDLLILFTHTVSHKLAMSALLNINEKTRIVRSHTSSMASLQSILDENVAALR